MAAVIEFPMDRTGKTGRVQGDASAEVIIFPGVRIERENVSLAERLTPSSPRKAR